MVEVTQVRVKWDGTGAQNEQEATVRGCVGGGASAQGSQDVDR